MPRRRGWRGTFRRPFRSGLRVRSSADTTTFEAPVRLENSRSTLSGWVGGASWWLEALHERLATHVMTGDRVFTDDTPLPMLEPGLGWTRTGHAATSAVLP